MTKRIESPLGNNRWHHGNGVLVCGSVRIARADFDTNPSQEFQTDMFDWICQTLNAEKIWKPIESAPYNLRVMVASETEMAMGWLDVIDNQLYYAPQGGLIKHWIPTKWQHIPE